MNADDLLFCLSDGRMELARWSACRRHSLEHRFGQILGQHRVGRAQHNSVLDRILEFAHISGPVIVQ